MEKRACHKEKCLEEAHRIRTAVDKICHVQDQAILYSMGLQGDTSLTDKIDESTSNESSDSECTASLIADNTVILPPSVSFDSLEKVLQDGNYNWFEVIEFVEEL